MKFLCPDCGSQEVWSTETTTWMMNTWVMSSVIKAHDSNSYSGCNHCGWVGVRDQLVGVLEKKEFRPVKLYDAGGPTRWGIEVRDRGSQRDADWDIVRTDAGGIRSWPDRATALSEIKALQELSGEPK